MNEKFNGHIWRHDFRRESLNQIIDGLNRAMKILYKRVDQFSWYDATSFLEDIEPIVGLAFVAFQNYIYGSIKDRFQSNDTIRYIQLTSPRLKQYNRNEIELVVALANYCKHMDGNLNSGTKRMLLDFKLSIQGGIDNSPLISGLELLSSEWDLEVILIKVTSWRECLWTDYEDL